MKKIEVKNIIGGISQQPALQRFENQCSEMINCLPSATEFLRRRYGSHHIAELEYTGNEFIDFIKRSDEEYGLLIVNKKGEASVYDLLGNLIGKSAACNYLACDNPRSDLRLCTIRDYNFLLNTKKKVQELKDNTSAAYQGHMVFIKQASYDQEYQVIIDGVVFSYKTPVTDNNGTYILSVENIARELTNKINGYKEVTYKYMNRCENIGAHNVESGMVLDQSNLDGQLCGRRILIGEIPGTDGGPSTSIFDDCKGRLRFAGYVYDDKPKLEYGDDGFDIRNPDNNWIIHHDKPVNTQNRFVATYKKGIIYIANKDNKDMVVETWDGYDDNYIISFKDTCYSFSDLPVYAPNGFYLKVLGDTATNSDDYYIQFKTEDNADKFAIGKGAWVEREKMGEQDGLQESTMPYILKINSSSITLETATWEKRKAGDRETNPAPDITGKQIKDIVFYKNRLGLLTDDGITFSESKRFFNFFATTATTMLDSDPISVAISGTKADALKYAVSYMEALFLYSNASMYALEHGDVLSNSSAAIKPVIQFDTNMSARPVVCDTSIYYTGEKGEYVRVREYKPSSQTDVYGYSNDITSHIPRYIEQGIYKICVSLEDGMLFLINGTDTVYCYSFIKENNELLQSAWHKWIFGGDVLYGEILQGYLYLLIKRNGKISFEKLAISHSDTNFTDNLKSDGSFEVYKSSYTFSTFFIRNNAQAVDIKTLLKTMTIKTMEDSIYFVIIKRKGRQEEIRQVIGNNRNRFLVMAENKDVEISIESYRDSKFNIIEYDMEVVYATRAK